MISEFTRYQKGISVETLFPTSLEKKCACGCGMQLIGRKKKWYSRDCQQKSLQMFYIIKGDTQVIRELVFKRDQGFCYSCGVFDENWQADHILPVYKGGGAKGLENFQTLCPYCHKNKTKLDRIPYCLDIHTTSVNIFHSPLERFRAFHKSTVKDIIGY